MSSMSRSNSNGSQVSWVSMPNSEESAGTALLGPQSTTLFAQNPSEIQRGIRISRLLWFIRRCDQEVQRVRQNLPGFSAQVQELEDIPDVTERWWHEHSFPRLRAPIFAERNSYYVRQVTTDRRTGQLVHGLAADIVQQGQDNPSVGVPRGVGTLGAYFLGHSPSVTVRVVCGYRAYRHILVSIRSGEDRFIQEERRFLGLYTDFEYTFQSPILCTVVIQEVYMCRIPAYFPPGILVWGSVFEDGPFPGELLEVPEVLGYLEYTTEFRRYVLNPFRVYNIIPLGREDYSDLRVNPLYEAIGEDNWDVSTEGVYLRQWLQNPGVLSQPWQQRMRRMRPQDPSPRQEQFQEEQRELSMREALQDLSAYDPGNG